MTLGASVAAARKAHSARAATGVLALAVVFQIATAIVAATAEPIPLRIAKAAGGIDARTKDPYISLTLTPSSAKTFGELTKQNIGRKTEIRVDGRTVMSPVIREPILGGVVQVSGKFTVKEVGDIVDRLNAGTAKVEIEVMPD